MSSQEQLAAVSKKTTKKKYRYDDTAKLFPPNFRFNKTRKCFTLNNKSMRGIINMMDKIFCPPGQRSSWVHEMCNKVAQKKRETAVLVDIHADGSDSKKKTPNLGKNWDPMLWGLKIHKEVADIINYDSSCHPKEPQMQTKLILEVISNVLKLKMIAAEVPVFDEPVCVATCVDVMARDKYGNWVIVEVKTGRHEDYAMTFGKLMYPLHSIDLSKKTLHQLQLMGTVHLFKQRFKDQLGSANVTGVVVLCSYTKIEVVPLQKWATGSDAQTAMRIGMKNLTELYKLIAKHESSNGILANTLDTIVESSKKKSADIDEVMASGFDSKGDGDGVSFDEPPPSQPSSSSLSSSSVSMVPAPKKRK